MFAQHQGLLFFPLGPAPERAEGGQQVGQGTQPGQLIPADQSPIHQQEEAESPTHKINTDVPSHVPAINFAVV